MYKLLNFNSFSQLNDALTDKNIQLSLAKVNELVKNERRAQALADEICQKAKEICASCSAEATMGDVSMIVSISKIDMRYMAAIESMLADIKPEMEKQDLVLSWSENSAAPAVESPQIVAHIKSVHTIRVKPPRYVYHFTNADSESILSKGLVPMPSSSSKQWGRTAALEYPQAIFAIADDETHWSGKNLFEIDTQGLKNRWWKDLNFSDKGYSPAIMTFEPIPADHIRMIANSERSARTEAKKAAKKAQESSVRAEEAAFADAIQKGSVSYEGKDPAAAETKVAKAIASHGGKEAIEWYFSSSRNDRKAQMMANMAAAAGNREAEELVYSMFPDVDSKKAAKWAAMSRR